MYAMMKGLASMKVAWMDGPPAGPGRVDVKKLLGSCHLAAHR